MKRLSAYCSMALLVLFSAFTHGGTAERPDDGVEWIVNPSFVRAYPFHEGLAPVLKDGKMLYINKAGQPVFDMKDAVILESNRGIISGATSRPLISERFCEGMVRFARDGKFGFMNRRGVAVIGPQYQDATDFTDGLAAVRRDKLWGYIDSTGKSVFAFRFEKAYPFSQGLAVVQLNGRYGYIDRKGAMVIEPRFDDADGFANDLANVKIGDKRGYIDMSGKMIIEPAFDVARSFSEDIACIKKAYRYSFIDKTGAVVLEVRAPLAGVEDFHDGLAAAKHLEKGSDGEYAINTFIYGFINKSGNFAIAPMYQKVSDFSEGLAAVKRGGKFGYVDSKGTIVIDFIFDEALPSSEDFLCVCRKGLWGYIRNPLKHQK